MRIKREDLIKKELIGKTILTKHGGNKLYTIQDVDFNLNPNDHFYLKTEKKDITFAEYFKSWYGLQTKDLW